MEILMFSWKRTAWAAVRAFVLLVVLATIAVHAIPRARGIDFLPQLRYAVLVPACAAGAVVAASLYRHLAARGQGRPRRALAAGLFVLAGTILGLLRLAGPPGLTRAAAPAVLGLAVALAVLVPRVMARPSGRLRTAATLAFGALELVGVGLALASEGPGQPTPDGLPFEVPRAMGEVSHRFLDLPSGARIHYVDEGSGQTLLFLHGNPAWSFQWRELIGGLRGSFRCVAPDYPGFGLSSAPAGYRFTPLEQSRVLEEFVDRLGLRDLTLVMHDWGGPIGLGLAARRPELVRRVILGNTWAWPTPAGEPRGMFSKVVGGPLGEFAQMNFNAFAAAAIGHDTTRPLPEEVVDGYLRPFRRFEGRGVAAFYPGQITAASDYLAAVESGLGLMADRPALIFWGMQDPGFPRADLERFQKALPQHHTVELADARHFFYEGAAPRMIEEIGRFMAGEAPRPSPRIGRR
jgi:pimeloyl-ACP methyl ester carboxylesterase